MNSIQKLENKISFFSRNVVISLLIIGFAGLILRLYFLNTDIPLHSDNLVYFQYAVDLVLNHTSQNLILYNDGWSYFLSLFFVLMPSENYLEYMALQKYISIIISVLTIIPIYYFGRHFFSRSYSILCSAIFVFEPRIVQNSLFGITEPLYLIGITTSLALLFSKKNYLQYISFAAISFTAIIRSEALFLLAIYGIIFVIQKGIRKKTILQILIISLIVFSILYPISEIRSDKKSGDGLTERISLGITHFESASENNSMAFLELLSNGVINMLKFLGWSQIPILIFFVPVGIVLVIKSRNFHEKSIIIIALFAILPTIYAYSFVSESRYLFSIYPIFSIIGVYSLRYYFGKIQNKKIVTMIIFSVIFSTTFVYLDSRDNYEHELELYNLSIEVSERVEGVNLFYPESSYLKITEYAKIEKFPVKSDEILEKTVKRFWITEFSSLNEIIEYGESNGITHLVLDEKDREPKFLKEIFQNEEKYPFLVKEFDSKIEGYQYHLKIFKIDYEKFNLFKKI